MNAIIEAKPLLTPADLLAMPDEGKGYELDDGVLVERNVSKYSSETAAEILRLLGNHCAPGRIAKIYGADLGFQCFPGRPNKVCKPDVSLILRERSEQRPQDEAFSPIPPDLAVEVVAPNDTVGELEKRVADYFHASVRLVWIVYPTTRRIYVERPDGSVTGLGPDAELSGEDVIPGFRCRVGDFFPMAPAAKPPA